jgi:uncharacterized protein (TIGR03435 family)
MKVCALSSQAVLCAAVLMSNASIAIHAQTAAPAQPRFDVATIRTSDPSAGHGMSLNARGDSLTGHNITLNMLIRTAYGLNDDQISGGPDWVASRRFDINAKADTPMDPNLKPEEAQAVQRQMFQQLLADRFHLQVHHATKEMPGYQLTIGKNGTRGLQSDSGSERALTVTDGKLKASAVSMDDLAMVLGQRVIQSPVQNATGLAGTFNIELKWDPAQTRAAAAADAATDNGPSIFVALQQQLGLRLEPHKTTADAIVIDSAQMPQEN